MAGGDSPGSDSGLGGGRPTPEARLHGSADEAEGSDGDEDGDESDEDNFSDILEDKDSDDAPDEGEDSDPREEDPSCHRDFVVDRKRVSFAISDEDTEQPQTPTAAETEGRSGQDPLVRWSEWLGRVAGLGRTHQ